MFEANAIYTGGDPATMSESWSATTHPFLIDAGAAEASAWLMLTGPLAGSTVVSSRWESLSALADFIGGLAAATSASGDLATVAAPMQLQMRVVSIDRAVAGDTSGRFLVANRFTYTTSPTEAEFERAAQIAVEGGATGTRVLQLLAAGEWSNDVVGAAFFDDLDNVPKVLAHVYADDEFVAVAQRNGAQLKSRAIFRRI